MFRSVSLYEQILPKRSMALPRDLEEEENELLVEVRLSEDAVDQAYFLLKLSSVQAELADPTAAIHTLRHAASLAPHNPDIFTHLAWLVIQHDVGRRGEARQLLARAEALGTERSPLTAWFSAYVQGWMELVCFSDYPHAWRCFSSAAALSRDWQTVCRLVAVLATNPSNDPITHSCNEQCRLSDACIFSTLTVTPRARTCCGTGAAPPPRWTTTSRS